MIRLLVVTLVASLATAAPALAADSVLATATRLAREAGKDAPPPGTGTPSAPAVRARSSGGSGATIQDQSPGLTSSGMGKGKKILIGVTIAAAVAGVIYAIDQGVEDNTPSSRGLR
jgi:hypothetical protein